MLDHDHLGEAEPFGKCSGDVGREPARFSGGVARELKGREHADPELASLYDVGHARVGGGTVGIGEGDREAGEQ